MKIYGKRLYIDLLLACLLLSGCSTLPLNQTVDLPQDDAIARAIAYLQNEYNDEVGLIRESPITAPERHWLATDNLLAVYALDAAGQTDLADALWEKFQEYQGQPHGIIEAIAGQKIEWPPRAEEQFEVTPQIYQEIRNREPMLDWDEYADLRLYNILSLYNGGQAEEAHQYYQQVIEQFNGVGYADKAFEENYTTYKLALTIYCGVRIGAEIPDEIVQAFLGKQMESGGFVSLYTKDGQPIGDTNTETTSYALLALLALRSDGTIFAQQR